MHKTLHVARDGAAKRAVTVHTGAAGIVGTYRTTHFSSRERGTDVEVSKQLTKCRSVN